MGRIAPNAGEYAAAGQRAAFAPGETRTGVSACAWLTGNPDASRPRLHTTLRLPVRRPRMLPVSTRPRYSASVRGGLAETGERCDLPISAAAIRGAGVFYPYTIQVVAIRAQEGAQCALVVEVSAGADVHEGYGGWVKP